MGDHLTRKIETPEGAGSFASFLESWRGALVIVAGGAEGSEYELDQPKISMGRGPGVDLTFDDSAMSREHAVLEFSNGSFRIRDVGSTNGTLLNGDDVKARGLSHGDRLQLGEHTFQFILEKRERRPRTYLISED